MREVAARLNPRPNNVLVPRVLILNVFRERRLELGGCAVHSSDDVIEVFTGARTVPRAGAILAGVGDEVEEEGRVLHDDVISVALTRETAALRSFHPARDFIVNFPDFF